MAAKRIETKIFFLSLAVLLFPEVGTRVFISESLLSPTLTLGLARVLQVVLILSIVSIWGKGISSIGLAPHQMATGLRKGLIWSAVFGIVVLLGFVTLYIRGVNPVTLIRAKLPTGQGVFLFFLVGSLVAPVAEEVFFRGILYGFLRRWGVLLALIISTLMFVLAHSVGAGFPVTQVVGGILFAVAYEVEGNLMVPITIHVLGNSALFTLAFIS